MYNINETPSWYVFTVTLFIVFTLSIQVYIIMHTAFSRVVTMSISRSEHVNSI